MAASTRMSYNHMQNGTYGSLPKTLPGDMEVTQDMHLKMSKKIAQLTKVIYALNTKNDEHETVVQQLKEQHEDEMQKLLKETKEKLNVYKTKLDGESVHNQKIEKLESSLREQTVIREKYIQQFDSFKRQAEERETQLKSQHAEKMLEFSHDVLHTKKEFEEKLKQFDIWKESVNEENEKRLNELKNSHETEIEDVRNHYRDQNDEWLNEVRKVEDKFKDELQALQDKCNAYEQEKILLGEEYDGKLAKAQLFYEKELNALKSLNNVSEEEAQRLLREEKEKMMKDFAALEAEMKKQINSLLGQVTDLEDEIEINKAEISRLQGLLSDKDGSASDLEQQLKDALQKASANLASLKEAESELGVMKERCSRQEDEMLKKSTLIGQLEATKHQNESTIQELEAELNRLKDKLSWLEKERNNLEKQKSDLNQNQLSQLHTLEKALEDLSIEKQTMKERYEREIDNLNSKFNKSGSDLTKQHQQELENLRKKAAEELEAEKKRAEKHLDQVRQELLDKHRLEMEQLSKEKDMVTAELERVKSELGSRLKAAESEVARVNSILQNKEQGLGSATGVINNLKDANNKLQQQVEKATANYKEEKSKSSSLQAELDKLRMQYEAAMKEAKIELQQKLENLSAELELKWQDTLRIECKKLRQEINEQKESEMRAALEQLSRMKDEEIAATRSGWEAKVEDLTRQIARLKESLQNSDEKSRDELELLKQEAEEQRKKLEEEMLKAANEYLVKIQMMEAAHDEAVAKLKEQNDSQLETLESKLKDKHIEDMHTQMSAHRATIESVKDQAEKSKLEELKELRAKYEEDKEMLRNQMFTGHMEEIERIKKEHESHLGAARMELERAVEISKQKEKDHALRVEDLQGEVTHRDRHIVNLKEDTSKLQITITHLNKEIEFKRQEIQKVKSDTANQIRIREKQLHEKMDKALDNLKADHIRESQELVMQFNEAQEILKDKISELQILLEDAEERYANRESRPEDLELIEQLRSAILEKQEKIHALVEEKKFFQLELVNRETNFNKVFSAAPNVGVLNPLEAKKRKGDKARANGSAPNLSGRLDPLPGSPMHHSQLNPKKTLPPFQKKFVR